MIVAAGLSPAWQQISVLGSLRIGEVNRAETTTWCASGKALNVGRGAHALGEECCTISVAGGASGHAIVQEFERDEIAARWVRTAAATRVCTTLLDTSTGAFTEIVENAPPLTDEELAEFEEVFLSVRDHATVVALSGSLPAGTPDDFYARLLEGYRGMTVLDARGPELLAALPHGPTLVKPNREELALTEGREIPEGDQDLLLSAMQELRQLGAESVLVTAGPDPAWLLTGESAWPIQPFPLEDCVNPIGCGDCTAAGIAVALSLGRGVDEAVRWGLAAAHQNAGSLLPARLTRAHVEALLKTDGA